MNNRAEVFARFSKILIDEKIMLTMPEENKEHAAAVLKCYNHPLVEPFISDGFVPSNITDALGVLKHFREAFLRKSGIHWCIVTRDDNQWMGSVGFWDWNRENNAEIYYELDPEYWGKGIMTKIVTKIIDFALYRMCVNRIQAVMLTDNDRSEKLLNRIGFQYEGLISQYRYHRNECQDNIMYSYTMKNHIKRIQELYSGVHIS